MHRASIPLATGCALWLVAASVQAFGFGRASTPTTLGQPLNFTTLVRVEPDESLVPECVSAEVIAGDVRLQPSGVRIAIEAGAGATERIVRVTTTAPIDEPVVTVTVTLGCASRISRRFVAFIDPPSVSLAQSSIVESTSVETPRQEPAASAPVVVAAPAPSSAAPKAAAAASAPGQQRVQTVRRARAPGVMAPVAAPRPRSPDSASTAQASQGRPAARAAGPRLQLEAAAPIVGRAAASAPTAAAESVAAAAQRVDSTVSLLTEQSEMLAKERARLLALEESLTRLRAESEANRAALNALQARVKSAEAERFANPLVYVLAWLSALLGVAVAVLAWRQRKGRRDPQWWAQQAPPPAVVREAAVTEPPPPPAAVAKRAASPVQVERPRSTWGDSRLTEAPPEMVPEPRRDLSVEELIDLEQQAEFFVVLGQDEAAIDLLMGHVRNTGGISPLPYLKLLEIYKRRGERSAYERIRERFNRRFNAYAPDWDADLTHGKSLEDYPGTMVKLEGLWAMPQRVMEVLDAMLFRRDESEEAYDLPAYRELLFLYSVARDFTTRSAQELSGEGVDLLLPLEAPMPMLRLRPTHTSPGPLQSGETGPVALDLDMTSPMPVDFEPSPVPTQATPARAYPQTENSDYLDLSELPTGPGKLEPRR